MKVKIGDKLVDVDTSSGKPVIHATAKEIPRADGGVDVVVSVPCLQIQAKKGV